MITESLPIFHQTHFNIMKKHLLFVLWIASAISSFAQEQQTLFGRNGLDISGFWYSNTNNFSLYEANTKYFSGGSVLFEFNQDFFLGWGWERMQGDAPLPDGEERFDLRLSGFKMAYAPFSHKVIHPRISILGSSGRLDITDSHRERVFALQPAGGLELNVLKWFRLGGEVGYRFVADIDYAGLSRAEVSSPFAQLQFRFGFSW